MQYQGLGDPLGGTLSLGNPISGVEPSIIHSRIGGNVSTLTGNLAARNGALKGSSYVNQVSAFNCGQVSEVSSQGEASRPTFAPKIDSSRLPTLGGLPGSGQDMAKQKTAMRVTGHSLGVTTSSPQASNAAWPSESGG